MAISARTSSNSRLSHKPFLGIILCYPTTGSALKHFFWLKHKYTVNAPSSSESSPHVRFTSKRWFQRKGKGRTTQPHTPVLTHRNYPQLKNKPLLIELASEHQNSYWKGTILQIKREKQCLGEQILMRFAAVCTGKSNLTRQISAYGNHSQETSDSVEEWFSLFGYRYFPRVLLLYIKRNQKLDFIRDYYGNSCSLKIGPQSLSTPPS